MKSMLRSEMLTGTSHKFVIKLKMPKKLKETKNYRYSKQLILLILENFNLLKNKFIDWEKYQKRCSRIKGLEDKKKD